jgi:hypothetical protein
MSRLNRGVTDFCGTAVPAVILGGGPPSPNCFRVDKARALSTFGNWVSPGGGPNCRAAVARLDGLRATRHATNARDLVQRHDEDLAVTDITIRAGAGDAADRLHGAFQEVIVHRDF